MEFCSLMAICCFWIKSMRNDMSKFNVLMLCTLCALTDIAVQASDELKMGVFPRRNSVVTVKMFTPLAQYLSKQLGVPVKLETAKNFPTFWENVTSKKYDIVHYNQLHYLLSHKSVGYDVFAKNEEFGQSNIQSSIIVRKDSGIKTIADLKGKEIIFGGGKLAMVAYVGVKLMLLEGGLKETDYKTIIARNPPNSSLAVFFNKASAGGVGDIALSVPSVTKRVNANELMYLSHGHRQAHIPWAYSPNLNDTMKSKVMEVFVNLSKTLEGKNILKKAGLTGIQKAVDKDYDNSRNIYRKFKKLLKK